jgi:hypothetical protein
LATIKYRDTRAGWLGPTRKLKKGYNDGLIMRIEYESSTLSKEEITQAVEAGDVFEVKKYQGETTLFKPSKVLGSDPWGIDVAGERVT